MWHPNGLNLLEDTPPPAELTCNDLAHWLGFAMSLDRKQMRFDLNETAWDRLNDGLLYALSIDEPHRRMTSQLVSSWMDYTGPTYRTGQRNLPYRNELVGRVATMLTDVGRIESHRLPERILHHMWRTASQRWLKRRRRVQHRLRVQDELERTYRQFPPAQEEVMLT